MPGTDNSAPRSAGWRPDTTRCRAEYLSLAMISANDAAPCPSSASPAADGSREIASISASPAPSPTSTTRASSASARANVIAAPVVSMPGAMPSTAICVPSSLSRRRLSANSSSALMGMPGSCGRRITAAIRSVNEPRPARRRPGGAAVVALAAAGAAGPSGARTGAGVLSAKALPAARPGIRVAALAGPVNSSRVKTMPDISTSVARLAISTVGSFFG